MAILVLFGAVSEIAGSKKEELAADTLGEVLDAAAARFGERFERALSHCTIAVDGETLERPDPSIAVADSTEIAVLPPVSGGATASMPESGRRPRSEQVGGSGQEPRRIGMADVAGKPITHREATARCRITASEQTLDAVVSGKLPKGDAVAAAELAAILGAKLTPQLVPLCHPVAITSIDTKIQREAPGSLAVSVTVCGQDRTGFEMEAMAAAAAAALTIYDMTKAMEPGVRIEELRLLSKSGGKSGAWRADE